jgi:hypothetical protein
MSGQPSAISPKKLPRFPEGLPRAGPIIFLF